MSADKRPKPALAITSGEPAGIGPELCARLAERDWPLRPVILGDIDLLRERGARAGFTSRFEPWDAHAEPGAGVRPAANSSSSLSKLSTVRSS